jgi:hypothetical protein
MIIIQLYQEFHDINKTKPTGNVVVIYWDSSNGTKVLALGRSYPHPFQDEHTPIAPNQPVTHWRLGDDLDHFLNHYCLPVTKQEARLIHPYLFSSCMDAELQTYRETDNIPTLGEWMETLPAWMQALFSITQSLPGVHIWAQELFGYNHARRYPFLPRDADILIPIQSEPEDPKREETDE